MGQQSCYKLRLCMVLGRKKTSLVMPRLAWHVPRTAVNRLHHIKQTAASVSKQLGKQLGHAGQLVHHILSDEDDAVRLCCSISCGKSCIGPVKGLRLMHCGGDWAAQCTGIQHHDAPCTTELLHRCHFLAMCTVPCSGSSECCGCLFGRTCRTSQHACGYHSNPPIL